MKIKKFMALCAVALGIGAIASCSGKEAQAEEQQVAQATITVDSLMMCAPGMVGDTVTVSGAVSHLCSHGATKAFILSTDSTQMLRCQATPEMGGAFSPECMEHVIVVRGIVRENRIDEDAIKAMEERYAVQSGNADNGCATERSAEGQDSTVVTFADRMADYRTRIAAQVADGGNPYLSFYYLETVAYDIQ